MKNQIESITEVYNWMEGIGVDLKSFEPSNYQTDETITLSSFKSRAERIKMEMNYKFNQKRDICAGVLALYERKNRLAFERG